MWGTLSNALWVGLVVYLVAFRFKKEFSELLNRVRYLGPRGAEFGTAERQRAEAESLPSPGQLKELPGVARTPATADLEQRLRQAVAVHTTQAEREDFLFAYLAQEQLSRHFAETYNVIFGSQIVGLRNLNERGRAPLVEARAFYDHYKTAYPQFYNTYPFENWLGFLSRQELIRVQEENVEITPYGRDFLLYIVAKQLPEQKPG